MKVPDQVIDLILPGRSVGARKANPERKALPLKLHPTVVTHLPPVKVVEAGQAPDTNWISLSGRIKVPKSGLWIV